MSSFKDLRIVGTGHAKCRTFGHANAEKTAM